MFTGRSTSARVCLATMLLFVAVGCATAPGDLRTKVISLNGETPEALATMPARARPVDSVKCYSSKAAVGRQFDVFAVMSGKGRSGDERAFHKAMVRRAAELNADGVIFYRTSKCNVNGAAVVYAGEAIRFHPVPVVSPPLTQNR